MTHEYEWVGTEWRKPTRPPFIAERRPYDECPKCSRSKFRPVYDGRTDETTRRCKNCKFSKPGDEDPDIHVETPSATPLLVAVLLTLVLVVGYAIVML